MNDILQTNIFFFITAIGVIVITVLLAIVLSYGIKFIKNISEISEEVKDEAHEYVGASQDFREKVSSHPLVKWFAGKKKTRKSKRD